MARIAATLHVFGFRLAEARRTKDRGQTAAEYLGIIVVVAAIIAVLASTDIGTQIKNAISEQITKITGGGGAAGGGD